MPTLNGSGQWVTVQGRVRVVGRRITLIPSLPAGITTSTGWELAPVGALSAAEGDHVSVDGRLAGDVLEVTGWTADAGPDALHRHLRAVDGVPHAVAVAVSHPGVEAGLIGMGMTTNRRGEWANVVHVAWATEQTRQWVAAQPPRSVYVHGFVRDAGLPALLWSEAQR